MATLWQISCLIVVLVTLRARADHSRCCYHDCSGSDCNTIGTYCTLTQHNCESDCHGTWCPNNPGPGPPMPSPSPGPPAPPSPSPPPSNVCPRFDGQICDTDNFTFPEPTVQAKKLPLTDEQSWMQTHYPDYMNGVSLGGLFVIEDWMFQRTNPPYDPTSLHLQGGEGYSYHQWSQDLLAGGNLSHAYATIDCHLRHYLNETALTALAEFGYNAVRLPVGYWLFDDPELYPNDTWSHPPSPPSEDPLSTYGVNPDGFVTPGTRLLSDMVMRLHNHNMRVVIDMHALPGCSSPRQSYAGILCAASR